MGRRIPRGAGWRLVAIMTLVIALVATFPLGVRAASGIAVSVTDEAGTPLAGAAFGVYGASVDPDGVLFIDPAAALIGGPVVTDVSGLAYLAGLPDGLTVGVRQLVNPDGYQADVAGDRFLTTDPAMPGSLAIVNAAFPVVDQRGTVVVSVTERSGATALDGVTIEVQAVDPATGVPGDVVSSTVSDAAGLARLILPAGSYVVSVVPPGGYQPVAVQPVAVTASAEGVLSVTEIDFDLQPEPTASPTVPVEPSPPPTDPAVATETVVPETAQPSDPASATQIAVPDGTGTVTPEDSAVPSSAATEPASSGGSDVDPGPPAFVAVRAIVCTSDDPQVIGTTVINRPTEALADGNAGLPPDCRSARQGEFTFVFRDLRMPSPWDDLTLGLRPTDSDGIALFDTVITRDGQAIFIYEQSSPNAFSSLDPLPLVADGTVSMIAIVVVGEPRGDVAVRTLDSVSGQPVASACYDLAAAGAADVPLASACDADDGADGTVRFPAVANGEYVVVPATIPAGYVIAPTTPLTVASQPVDLPLTADPFGTLQLVARSCLTRPAGVPIPTPTPAPGDGIEGLGDMTPEILPPSGPSPTVVFLATEGSTIDAAGTGVEGAVASDCSPVGASLIVTAPDGSTTTIVAGQDGFAIPLALAPTTSDERYTLRDEATGAHVLVAITPASMTALTLLQLPGGAGDATSPTMGMASVGTAGGSITDTDRV